MVLVVEGRGMEPRGSSWSGNVEVGPETHTICGTMSRPSREILRQQARQNQPASYLASVTSSKRRGGLCKGTMNHKTGTVYHIL